MTEQPKKKHDPQRTGDFMLAFCNASSAAQLLQQAQEALSTHQKTEAPNCTPARAIGELAESVWEAAQDIALELGHIEEDKLHEVLTSLQLERGKEFLGGKPLKKFMSFTVEDVPGLGEQTIRREILARSVEEAERLVRMSPRSPGISIKKLVIDLAGEKTSE